MSFVDFRITRILSARLLLGILVSTLILGGCSGNDGDQNSNLSEAAAQAKPKPKFWPLTGEKVAPAQSPQRAYPILITKMDNTEGSSPQLGLAKADLVVEELVEGGVTRLAAFYYSQLPSKVGPVRSMRASDIGIVSPAQGSVVTSGAALVTINRIRGAGITFYQEGAPGFSRDNARYAPYNLFADLREISRQAKHKSATPDPYLEWGAAEDLPRGKPARTIQASFGYHTTNWQATRTGYRNTNSFAAPDDQFPTESVLAVKVEVGDAGYLDPAGNPVPETILKGTGKAYLFYGGRVISANWQKKDLKSPLALTTLQGKELKVPAGHVWIELVPAASGSVTWQS
jgi:hypothetical protein